MINPDIDDEKMNEIKITYETLFEILRREKNRDELQRLNENFLQEVADYIIAKKAALEQQRSKNDMFSAEEGRKAEVQYENMKKMFKEIYEKRERKIINMALDQSRISEIIDCSALLAEEKKIYDSLLNVLNMFRKGILVNLLEAKMPETDNIRSKESGQKNGRSEEKGLKENTDINNNNNNNIHDESDVEKNEDNKKIEKEEKNKIVSFIKAVPRFIGKNLKEYGPYEKGQKEELPSSIVDLLINKGMAEEFNE